jgi:hypothetical protein
MTEYVTTARILLRSITFQPDMSAVVEYCIPAQDARQNGVVLNHIMQVPYGDDYDDEIDAVQDAVLALIDDVLEDLPHLEPMSFSKPEEDDEDDDDEEEGEEDAE